MIVHTILKEDFERLCSSEFRAYLIDIYHRKKKQRDITFELIKKDIEIRAEKRRSGNIFSFENTNINHLVNKNAVHGLSKYMHREKKGLYSKDASLVQLATSMRNNLSDSSHSPIRNGSVSPSK